MGVRVKVGFKDSVGVQIGPNFPQGTFGVHVASGALGAHGRLRATPLATNCWPKAPRGGGGGAGVVGVPGPAESPPPVPPLYPPIFHFIWAFCLVPGERDNLLQQFFTLKSEISKTECSHTVLYLHPIWYWGNASGPGLRSDPPTPEGILGCCTCAQAANSTKRRSKMGLSVAYNTTGTFGRKKKNRHSAPPPPPPAASTR